MFKVFRILNDSIAFFAEGCLPDCRNTNEISPEAFMEIKNERCN